MNRTFDFFHKLSHFEYWPSWAFYGPIIMLWPLFSFRGRSLLFFTAANPSIPNGGCFGESKEAILKLIPKKYLPQFFFIETFFNSDDFEKWRIKEAVDFPLVAKPDIGERGDNIRVLTSVEAIKEYAKKLSRPFLLQEYLPSTFELGVMVIKDPVTKKVKVSSIVSKNYLSVTGDGSSTLGELVKAQPRSRFQWQRLQNNYNSKEILSSGEEKTLEVIGNHKRGTTFLNANHLITPEVTQFFEALCADISGFYFGRFDLKAPNEESFLKGSGIKIMELNGAFSEPGHLYDPKENLLRAWWDLIFHWWDLAEVARKNQQQGFSATGLVSFYQSFMQYKKLAQLDHAYE